jgi:hypothetical protein
MRRLRIRKRSVRKTTRPIKAIKRRKYVLEHLLRELVNFPIRAMKKIMEGQYGKKVLLRLEGEDLS